jgi:hypothetical protein
MFLNFLLFCFSLPLFCISHFPWVYYFPGFYFLTSLFPFLFTYYQLPISLFLLLPISFIHVSHFSSILFSISLVMNYLHSSFSLSHFPHSLILCFLLPLFYVLTFFFIYHVLMTCSPLPLYVVHQLHFLFPTALTFSFSHSAFFVFSTSPFLCFLHFYLPFSLFSYPFFNAFPCSLLPSCSLIQK